MEPVKIKDIVYTTLDAVVQAIAAGDLSLRDLPNRRPLKTHVVKLPFQNKEKTEEKSIALSAPIRLSGKHQMCATFSKKSEHIIFSYAFHEYPWGAVSSDLLSEPFEKQRVEVRKAIDLALVPYAKEQHRQEEIYKIMCKLRKNNGWFLD